MTELDIIQIISDHNHCTIEQFFSPQRIPEAVNARKMASYYFLTHRDITLEAVGKLFKERKHDRIHYYKKKHLEHYEVEKDYKIKYDFLLTLLPLAPDRKSIMFSIIEQGL
jgi:chromosomal replication initiation ATPase DnaA